ARARTGEILWTFRADLRRQLEGLETAGLIQVMHGVMPKTLRAQLTEAGKSAYLSDEYTPPNDLDRKTRALEAIAEYAEARDFVIGMESVASTARRALGNPEQPGV
ncbi:hypothetical protein, partial [Paractinoplanes ferrugineus]